MRINLLNYSANPNIANPTTIQISVSNHTTSEGSHSRSKRDTWEEMAGKFNPDLDTKILVHGWKSSTTSDSIQSIRGAYTIRGNLNIFGKLRS